MIIILAFLNLGRRLSCKKFIDLPDLPFLIYQPSQEIKSQNKLSNHKVQAVTKMFSLFLKMLAAKIIKMAVNYVWIYYGYTNTLTAKTDQVIMVLSRMVFTASAQY